jgi:hypothetical protein
MSPLQLIAMHDIASDPPAPGGIEDSPRQAWALLAYDSATGCATTAVAFAGVDENAETAVSWVPLVGGADSAWRERLASAVGPGRGQLLRQYVNEVNGITVDAVELEVPAAADIAGVVEHLMDDYLAEAA